jgi:hypothetical protein
VVGDNVDLALAGAVVGVEDGQSLVPQIAAGKPLAIGAFPWR